MPKQLFLKEMADLGEDGRPVEQEGKVFKICLAKIFKL
jgi:hypothetical protein